MSKVKKEVKPRKKAKTQKVSEHIELIGFNDDAAKAIARMLQKELDKGVNDEK